MVRKLLKHIAPKAFLDGLERCNRRGIAFIAEEPAERMLDIGCGDGELTARFAAAAQAGEVHGIELIDHLCTAANARGIQCTGEDLNGRWSFGDASFDLIVSSQNIEHIHNTRGYLEECRRCLKPGGRLVVLTENLASWVNTGALLFGWQPFSTTNINGWSIGNPLIWHADEPRDESAIESLRATGVSGTEGHVRVLSYAGLRDLLHRTGFREVRMRSTGYLPLWGPLSAAFCSLDRRHGHFLVACGRKPVKTP